MIDFGYTINTQRVVNLDKNNLRLAKAVLQLEPSFELCVNCGTCTATCSANTFTSFSLRQLMLLVSRGEEAQASDEAAKCMLCGKCLLACPRGVNTRNVVIAIHQLSNGNQTTPLQ